MDSDRTASLKTPTQLSNLLLGLFLALTIPLLFTPELAVENHRLMPYIWNTGHILLFFALTWLTLNLLRLPRRLGFFSVLIFANLIVLILSMGIEEIQLLQARQSSWEDVYRNCLGASMVIIFHPNAPAIPNLLRAFSKILLVVSLLYALYPLTKNTVDWIYAHSSFPVLANFETPFEKERWVGGKLVTLNFEPNNFVLRYRFNSAKYSTVSLVHFPGNWHGYHCFSFRIYNPDPVKVDLKIRINDRQHDSSLQSYSDRFNHQLTVLPGWNKFAIDLDEIKTAPRDRLMDMTNVNRILFFSSYLEKGSTLYFDDLQLEGKSLQCNPISSLVN